MTGVQTCALPILLICPNMSESTIYRAEAPNGFYMQLLRGRVPAWLAPVQLPRDSPYRMWRVVRTLPAWPTAAPRGTSA